MTTDWNTRASEMVKTWTESQQRMWDTWIVAMREMGNMQSGTEGWEKSVDMWHESVKGALNTQVTWTEFWADSIKSVSGSSAQVNTWADQTLDMTRQWTATQTEMWDNWFKTLKTSDPSTMMQSFNPDDMMKMVQAWQESARKMMESQMEMVRMMTGTQIKP